MEYGIWIQHDTTIAPKNPKTTPSGVATVAPPSSARLPPPPVAWPGAPRAPRRTRPRRPRRPGHPRPASRGALRGALRGTLELRKARSPGQFCGIRMVRMVVFLKVENYAKKMEKSRIRQPASVFCGCSCYKPCDSFSFTYRLFPFAFAALPPSTWTL